MDVAKVDRDVTHVVYFCGVFSGMLQMFYLDVAYVSHICCKCFIWMLHMFHTHVASVLTGYCICFTHM
jgi:hypothetical protein